MEDNFNLVSRSLSSKYVFYERLNEDYPNVYSAIQSRMHDAKEEAARAKINTDFIYRQANAEREKELNLIEQMTGFRPTPMDWGTNAKNIIDAINLCINSKDVYNRISQVIMSEGKTSGKSMFSFFGGYLQSTLNDEWANFCNSLGSKGNLDITEQEIGDWLYKIVLPKAIQKMFNANVEDGVDSNLQQAYQELSQLVGTFDKTGSFAQQLANIYDLDHVASEIKTIIDKRKTKRKPGSIPSLTKNIELTYTRGGQTLEAMVDLMFKAAIPKDGKSGHANIGGLKAKADNLITIGIDCSEIADFFEKEDFGTREKNVAAFTALGNYLQKFSEGFIIYTSDKNYSLNDGFKTRGGFSAGSSLTLQQYETLMAAAGRNASGFIGAIEQLAQGAVGEDESKSDYADIISKNIAYLLFDDFDTIGAGMTNGPQSIHIMNLNGMFVPISAILYALGDALGREESIKGIVKTNIYLPQIKYETNDYGGIQPIEAWNIQREEMLTKSRIETHFLGNLRALLAQGMLR